MSFQSESSRSWQMLWLEGDLMNIYAAIQEGERGGVLQVPGSMLNGCPFFRVSSIMSLLIFLVKVVKET